MHWRIEFAYGLQVKANSSKQIVGIPALLDDQKFVEAVYDKRHTGFKNPGMLSVPLLMA